MSVEQQRLTAELSLPHKERPSLHGHTESWCCCRMLLCWQDVLLVAGSEHERGGFPCVIPTEQLSGLTRKKFFVFSQF